MVTCNSNGKPCKSSVECCIDTEACEMGACTPTAQTDPGHHTNKVQYESGQNCIKSCDTTLPDGVQPFCYANDDENPDEIQICAYESEGFLIPANGCCSKICPSEQCPPSIAPAAKPERDYPQGVEIPSRSDKNEPFPKLMKLILIVFAILLISAGIFLSVDVNGL